MPEPSRVLRPKEYWWPIAFVLGVSLFFGWIVLPKLDQQRQALEGHAAPPIDLPVIFGPRAGQHQTLADLSGQPVILDFWASWCKPCREQAPIVQDVWQRNKQRGVYALGIATGGDVKEEAVAFLQSHGIAYPSVYDENGRIANAYRVSELPTLVVVGRDGRVLAVRRRPVDAAELSQLVEVALR